MKASLFKRTLFLVLIFCLMFSESTAQIGSNQEACDAFSDTFDEYNFERWHDILLYSKEQGVVTVADGQLVLEASGGKPVEIQVYALFTFGGDFDIQVDYDFSIQSKMTPCRINAGVVLQTLRDEKSYKAYITARPRKGLTLRSRLDRFGENNIEKHKGPSAENRGKIRIMRKEGQIIFLAWQVDNWSEVYAFKEPCNDEVRMRFKLQTFNEKDAGGACPAILRLDNFTVNSCEEIKQK